MCNLDRTADQNPTQRDEVLELPGCEGETILLVEDEHLVRRLIAQTLSQQGYRVLEAATGMDALEIYSDYPGAIDLVLTDVVMPHMSGRKLVKSLKRRHPNLQVLFMSGYSADPVLRHGIEAGTVNFIQKPFTPSVIAQEIHKVLNRRALQRSVAVS